jgi:hypothetical protein
MISCLKVQNPYILATMEYTMYFTIIARLASTHHKIHLNRRKKCNFKIIKTKPE